MRTHQVAGDEVGAARGVGRVLGARVLHGGHVVPGEGRADDAAAPRHVAQDVAAGGRVLGGHPQQVVHVHVHVVIHLDSRQLAQSVSLRCSQQVKHCEANEAIGYHDEEKRRHGEAICMVGITNEFVRIMKYILVASRPTSKSHEQILCELLTVRNSNKTTLLFHAAGCVVNTNNYLVRF